MTIDHLYQKKNTQEGFVCSYQARHMASSRYAHTGSVLMVDKAPLDEEMIQAQTVAQIRMYEIFPPHLWDTHSVVIQPHPFCQSDSLGAVNMFVVVQKQEYLN